MYSIANVLFIVGLICLQLNISSCKKFVEVNAPYTSFNGENVYTTDATAISAVTAMFTRLGFSDGGKENRIVSISYCGGLSADELTLSPSASGILLDYYTNSLTATSNPLFWNHLYEHIYLANAAIEGLTKANGLTFSVREHLIGESKFMRAFCYFYLINLYGDVPLVTTTNYKVNSFMPREPISIVWKQIVNDLIDAKTFLNSNYLESDMLTSKTTTERIRPNKYAASALLSRVYLFTGEYTKAEAEASEIINNSALYAMSSISNTFLKSTNDNPEAIWQIQPVTSGWNTNEARVFVLPTTGPDAFINPFYLNKRLISSFENGDERRTNWIKGIPIGSDTIYYVYKYKNVTQNAPVTEFNTVLRLAEQYLIRAEARARQNNISGSQEDLNVIRRRAGLSNSNSATKDDLLASILNERRLELFTEWGHRWFDLKRTNYIDPVMEIETSLKGGSWESKDKLYPISKDELMLNPNISQTDGY